MTFDVSNNRVGMYNSNPLYTLDVNGTLKVSSNAIIGGGLTVAGGITTTTGSFSSNVVISGGVTVTGSLVGSGGITTTTGYFSSGVTVGGLLVGSGGITTTTGNFSSNVVISGGLTVVGSLAFSGGLTTTTGTFTGAVSTGALSATSGSFTGNITSTTGTLFTNTIREVSGSSALSILSAGSANLNLATNGGNVTIGNTANMTTSAIVLQQNTSSNGYFSMNRGGYVQGPFGLQFGQTTGTINTPSGGNGAVFGWNAVAPGSNNFELVLGRGNNANGGSFKIYGTTGAGQQQPSSGYILSLDQNGALITGSVISNSFSAGTVTHNSLGLSIGQCTGPLQTPAYGYGSAIAYNSQSGSNDLEVVIGRGNLPNGGSLRIYNTTTTYSREPGTQILTLDNAGNLTIPGILSAAPGGSIVPTGTIIMYATAVAPSGWVVCDGSLYDPSDSLYAQLYAVILTTYGGTPGVNFRVPDMRSRVPIGQGTGSGLSTYTMGSTGGAENVTLAATNMPPHNHTYHDPEHSHGYRDYWIVSQNDLGKACVAYYTDIGGIGVKTQSASTGISINNSYGNGSGGADPHENRMPYFAINYIIKL